MLWRRILWRKFVLVPKATQFPFEPVIANGRSITTATVPLSIQTRYYNPAAASITLPIVSSSSRCLPVLIGILLLDIGGLFHINRRYAVMWKSKSNHKNSEEAMGKTILGSRFRCEHYRSLGFQLRCSMALQMRFWLRS